MSVVTDIIDSSQLHDLWGAGYTVVARQRHPDPMHVDPAIIPKDRSYQWLSLKHDEIHIKTGWSPVPYSRHEGVFAPFGTLGDVEVMGCGLFDKPKFEVDKDRAHQVALAQKQIDDWSKKAADFGISGTVKVGTQTKLGELDTEKDIEVGHVFENTTTKVIETTVRIPRDMQPHMVAIFDERDRLETEVVRKDRTLAPGPIADQFYAAMDADKGAPWWPTLRAILLPIAIDNVRAKLKKDHLDD